MTADRASLAGAGPSPARDGQSRSSASGPGRPSGLSGARAGRAHLSAQLLVVMGASPSAHFLHARVERWPGGGFQNHYAPIGRVQDRRDHYWTEWLPKVGADRTVYLACAPRSGRVGGKQGVDRVYCLWADLDSDAALTKYEARTSDGTLPPASLEILSGGRTDGGRWKRHCYWRLNMGIGADEADRALKALQKQLGSDSRCAEPARVLRPVGSTWRKDGEVRTVELDHADLSAVYPLDRVVPRDLLVAEKHKRPPPQPQMRDTSPWSGLTPLERAVKEIDPPDYVEALTGAAVSAGGKAECPFHPDWNPSLHAYPDAERGWFCFQCGRGGTIVDLAAELYGLDPQTEYPAILRRLAHHLLGEEGPPCR